MKRAVLFAFMALSSVMGWTQNGDFKAYVNQNPVSTGDRFKITFELSNAEGEITPPPMTDFQIVFGPSKSSNFSYVNGQSSRSVSISYTVVAHSAGTFTIPSATAKTKKGTLKSAPITIQVNKKQAAASNNTATQQTQTKKNIASSDNLIIQAEVDKRSGYVGEGIVVKYILYSRYQSLELGEAEYPKWNGFWVKSDKPDKVSWDPNLTTINGNAYKSVLLDRQVIYPQKSGEIKIDPMKLRVFINRSFFNQGTAFDLVSNSIKLNIKRLPNNAPAGFKGSTGEYGIQSSISPEDSASVNSPITLKIKISGTGNLDLVSAPELNVPTDFESYEPKANKRYSTKNGKTTGYVEYEYLLIPRFAGSYEIPPYNFSFFSPRAKRYLTKTVKFPTIHIKGDNTNKAYSTSGSGLVDKQAVELLSQDIKYIAQGEYQEPKREFNAAHWLFSFAAGVPFLCFFIGLGIRKKRTAYLSDTQLVLKDKSHKLIKKHLGAAKASLDQQGDDFFQKIQEAFESFFVGFYGMQKGDINKKTIQATLGAKKVDAALQDQMMAILDQCEMARFASVSSADRESTYAKAQEVMKSLIQNAKK